MHDGRIVSGLNSYRIDEAMVGVGATDKSDGFLYFSLNRALTAADRARLVLHVGSARFPLSDAHFESSTHTYHWRNTGLDWSSTDQVTPRLRASPAAPTAVTATAPRGTGGLLEVTWSAPASAGSITGYEVKYWEAADPENRRSRNARTLIAHEDPGYREWGAGGSVRLDPGASGRGLSLSLAPVWGTPSSGVDRLWSARDAAGLAPGGEFEATRRLNAELGYGLGVPRGLGLVTPYAGLSLAEGGGRTWRTGARWQVMPGLTLGLEGTRNETANDDEPLQHGLIFRGALRW